MTEIRKASEAPFPYGWPESVCYFEIADADGQINWLRKRDETREAVTRALAQRSTIYAAWPGQYRTDLFIIDDVAKLAEAINLK